VEGSPTALAGACRAAAEELASALDLVRWGASRFAEHGLVFGHGTDNALDEARALVLHALHLPPDTPEALLAARLTRAEREACVALLRRRIVERRPAPYLTGEAWFAGLRFVVDERVLVPRSPLAEWIERGFAPWLDPERVRRVLDLGTGSGALAVACACAFPDAEVDAVERSRAALEVAARNVREHGLAGRVHLIESDLYAALAGRRYELIISNPPYVGAERMAALPPEYRHEPAAALAAGSDGLECLRRIIDGAPAHLAGDGVLVLEVGVAREALERAYPALEVVWLDLERGGENCCLIGAAALAERAG